MGRHENIALGPSWTVVIFAHPSPLLHNVIASGFCTAPGWVIGHISPSPHNGVCWWFCRRHRTEKTGRKRVSKRKMRYTLVAPPVQTEQTREASGEEQPSETGRR